MILFEQLASRIKGPPAENEDWWHLCYNSDTNEFYVEHEWSHVPIDGLQLNGGTEKHDANAWVGPGAEHIPHARNMLLDRANAYRAQAQKRPVA
ncbi:hypothetical protein [Bosea sp. BIWAKO-01]|uniref:hypothetical protein n=1 Tax=Bosea sp. BIWAKO-01 TaxID=506668 RepID=UPI00114C8659|nr:hypothetical protein [Bosea sp. BIWAKO-01]